MKKQLPKYLCITAIALFSLSGFAQPPNFYEAFSWYGSLTSAKDQKVQKPCHAFAAAAQVESIYDLLYYGQAEIDVSEGHLFSTCTDEALYDKVQNFLSTDGVVGDGCAGYIFPNIESDNWTDNYLLLEGVCDGDGCSTKYKTSHTTLNIPALDSDADLQDIIYEYGPIHVVFKGVGSVHGGVGGHSMLLYGWSTTENGLQWRFKDSWPDSATLNYTVDASELDITDLLTTKISAYKITDVDKYTWNGSSWSLATPSRTCVDSDEDGYCYWGIGDKPAGCSGCVYDEQDSDDDNEWYGAFDEYGDPVDATPIPSSYLTAPISQMTIYGPPQSAYCGSSHNINSSYFENTSYDQIDWVPYYGSTPTSYTGPSGNAPGAVGLYVYLEATGGCYNQTGILTGEYWIKIPDDGYALKYYYHMYGSSMGSHKVEIQKYGTSSWVQLGSTLSGNKGNSWYSRTLNLDTYAGYFIKIRFVGTTGYGQYSDMAIQNVSVITTSKKGATEGNSTTIQDEIDSGTNTDSPVKIYPNPVKDLLYIELMDGIEYNVTIINMSGQTLINKNAQSSTTLDIKALPKGSYIVNVRIAGVKTDLDIRELIVK